MSIGQTFSIETLGCKVNQYESEALRESLLDEGYLEAGSGEVPDLAIIHTCSVTHLADRKSRQSIRKFARMSPKPRIAVLGCYSQISAGEVEKIEGVDLIMGTYEKGALTRLLSLGGTDGKKTWILPHDGLKPYDSLALKNHHDKTRAYIKIQDGCGNYCSYCIIPYTRGRSRSRPLAAILDEARILAGNGYREAVLIGIQSASYGTDLKEEVELTDVVKAVAGTPGILRVRLGSAEPTYFTEERLEKLSGIKSFCPHFHLSLQSGSDRILKAMNRKYTTGQYREILENIRRLFKNPAITTDLIVGFPGETDGDFKDTMDFVSRMAFSDVHVFRYSKREGTAAVKMGGHVNPSVAKVRSDLAILKAREAAEAFLDSQRDIEEKVLFESSPEKGIWEGLSMNHAKVRVHAEESLAGVIYPVKLHQREEDWIWGEIISC